MPTRRCIRFSVNEMNRRRIDKLDKFEWDRQYLPYCFAVTDIDGCEVLLNRRYVPIWLRRREDGYVFPAPTDMHGVPGTRHIYNDSSWPCDDNDSRARCFSVLAEWGVGLSNPFQRGRPKVIPAKPSAKHHAAYARQAAATHVARQRSGNVIDLASWRRARAEVTRGRRL